MARISLLLSLAIVLAIGSVLAHPPSPKKTPNPLCPPTLSQLQSYPFIEISKIVTKQASTQETAQFHALFSICNGYTDYLGNVQKLIGSKDVLKKVNAMYSLMTRAMLEAQASVGVKGSLADKLRKAYTDMAHEFIVLPEKISTISAKYHFKGDAKIDLSDRIEIDNCLIKLKGSISVFVKVITQISKQYAAENRVDFSMKPGYGFIGGYSKKGARFGGKANGVGGVAIGSKSRARGGKKVGGGKFRRHIGKLFGDLFGLGAEAQFDAAGEANVRGEGEFQTLSNPTNKQLD